jgi:hypothetical protein
MTVCRQTMMLAVRDGARGPAVTFRADRYRGRRRAEIRVFMPQVPCAKPSLDTANSNHKQWNTPAKCDNGGKPTDDVLAIPQQHPGRQGQTRATSSHPGWIGGRLEQLIPSVGGRPRSARCLQASRSSALCRAVGTPRTKSVARRHERYARSTSVARARRARVRYSSSGSSSGPCAVSTF